MTSYIGISVQDLFLGTPEQFDNTFGGGIEWDGFSTTIINIELICSWCSHLDTKPSDVLITEFPTEEARDDWFRRMNGQIDAEVLHKQNKAVFPFDLHTYDLIRSKIADLKWVKDDASWSHDTWTAYGVEEHRLAMDPATNTIAYWAEGEGPVYTDMDKAKAAVNEHHKDTVMREFFK